jgi:hypothetical protein
MVCPKCNAKVGTIRELFATETGQAAGVLCFICGYWLQEYPKPAQILRTHPK